MIMGKMWKVLNVQNLDVSFDRFKHSLRNHWKNGIGVSIHENEGEESYSG